MNRKKSVLTKILTHMLHNLLVLIGITLVTYLVLYLSPRNPAELWLAGSDNNAGTVSEEAIAEQEHIMGLDKPFLVQYWNWLIQVAQGDLGTSFTTNRPVSEELTGHMLPTLYLAVISLAVTVAVAVPLGFYCAVHPDGRVDNILRVFSFIGISVPSFLLSLVMLWLFCLKLKLLPVIADSGGKGLIMPIFVLILQCTSKMIRQVRAIVLEQLEQPYIQGAVSRGVRRHTILFGHVLKNCTAAILTCISIYTGILLGGAAVIEGIFSVNGLGRLAVSSVARLDYYVLQGFVLWCALAYLIVNFAVDIISALVDPRMKREQV